MSVKMRFKEDKFYNAQVLYTKDVIYDVPDNMVDRWLKRGGEIIEAVVELPKPVLEVEAPVEDPVHDVEELEAETEKG